MTFGQTRHPHCPHLPRAVLAFFLIFAFAWTGITATPGMALAARSAKTKKKEEKKPDPLEMQARTDFAAGRFAEALDAFARLYASSLHPTYLWNIGRCYMNMDQPDRAATSFREYLRKAKDISEKEQGEVESLIQEMDEAQKKKDDAAAAVNAKPVEPTAPPPRRVTVLPPPPPPPPPKPAPFYTKGWFWGVVGGVVVVGVVGTLWATGTFSSKESCTSGYTCP
jgi:tetratricopeptide (TPR) repeat protein